jgi:hypothetical protein
LRILEFHSNAYAESSPLAISSHNELRQLMADKATNYEGIHIGLTPEQHEQVFRCTGIDMRTLVVQRAHFVALGLVAQAAKCDALPYGPSAIRTILRRSKGLTNAGALIKLVLTAAQREQISNVIGVPIASIVMAADDLPVFFNETWHLDFKPFRIRTVVRSCT